MGFMGLYGFIWDIMIWVIYIYILDILVGALEHVLFSPIVGMMIQSDFHIFQGVETTNQI